MKHTTLSRFASLAASAALALSLAACGSTSRSTYSAAVPNDTAALSSQDAGDYEYYSAESAAAGEGSSFSSDALTSSMLDPSSVESSRKIVYNASVRMETTDYDTTRAALQEAVTAANGYLESTDQGGSKDSGSRYTYYTARIPAENYRSFLTAAGEAGNVTSLNESAQDITAEYVDVEARLKALNDQRDRLNALADKAETTADLLEIESQLSFHSLAISLQKICCGTRLPNRTMPPRHIIPHSPLRRTQGATAQNKTIQNIINHDSLFQDFTAERDSDRR